MSGTELKQGIMGTNSEERQKLCKLKKLGAC